MDGGAKQVDAKGKPGFFTPFGIALFLLSAGYIAAEAIFNMKLLDVAGNVRSSPGEIQDLQHFGRAVSAYGFSLLTLGAFAGSGFYLRDWRYKAMFAVLAVASFIPFLMRTQQAVMAIFGFHSAGEFMNEPYDIQFSALPFLGLALVLLAAGRFRAHLVIGLVLMAWPAMYLGQKILIERYVIDRTDWEDRQNARYMLMLRAGLEDCSLQLGALQFCDASRGEPEMKSARIVVSTLWMMSPKTVLDDLEKQRGQIVENAASTGMWFSPQQQYQKYVDKVSDMRGKYVEGLREKYYKPYAEASALFEKAQNSDSIQKEADKAALEVEQGIDQGWQKYQAAVRDYRQSLTIMAGEALRRMAGYAGSVDRICNDYGNCPDMNVNVDRAMKEARDHGEQQFYQRSGYHTDIRDRAAFVGEPKTQEAIRLQIEKTLRDTYALKDYKMPPDWKYDQASFKERVKSIIHGKIEQAWKDKFGEKLPPGLDEKRFMAVFGVQDIPPVENLVMSEDEFYKSVVVPGTRKIADGMIADLAKDRAKYPLQETGMAEGKDFAEAMYIPTISLVISLSVVVLTLLRGFMALMDAVLGSGSKEVEAHWYFIGRGAVIALFAGMLLSLPRVFPNPYASGPAYERYYDNAKARHAVLAPVLDWAVQVQPVIYRLGQNVRRAATR